MPTTLEIAKLRDIIDSRDFAVVKSNKLIQDARFELSTVEQKIVLRLVQMIKSSDTFLSLYEFSIADFCRLCGIDETSGGNYALIKNTLKKLADKSCWVTMYNEKTGRMQETIVRWVEKPYIDRQSGIIKIKLDEDMKPMLLQLQEYFTQYSLYYVLPMKSKYSIRLYEILKSWQNIGKWTVSVEDLREQLMATKIYAQWGEFRKNVLQIAIDEIEKFTDLHVNPLEFSKDGRKISKVTFTFSTKPSGVDVIKNVEAQIGKRVISEGLAMAGVYADADIDMIKTGERTYIPLNSQKTIEK